jgi:hypothetical protein
MTFFVQFPVFLVQFPWEIISVNFCVVVFSGGAQIFASSRAQIYLATALWVKIIFLPLTISSKSDSVAFLGQVATNEKNHLISTL